MLLLLGGCGFTPLYGDYASGEQGSESGERGLGGGFGVEASTWLAGMRGAEIETPETAVGWHVSHFLRARQGRGRTPSGWRLEVRLDISREDLLVQRDSDVIRSAARLRGAYRLRDASDEVLVGGEILVSAAYNRVGDGFANEVARRNAEERAAREFAEQLWRRLALEGVGR